MESKTEKISGASARPARFVEDAPGIADNRAFQEAITHYDNTLQAVSKIEEEGALYEAAEAARGAAYVALCAIVDAHTARQLALYLAESRPEAAPPGK